MKIEISFIRNGNTELAQTGKFVGSIDVPLSYEGANEILNRSNDHVYPKASRIYTGSSRRCRETATLIYGKAPVLLAYRMNTMDLGEFEGKSYEEICETAGFIRWASSQFVETIPGGGPPHRNLAQNINSFRRIIVDLENMRIPSVSIVAERMVIQILLWRFVYPRSKYFNLNIPHGGGCTAICDTTSGLLRILKIF